VVQVLEKVRGPYKVNVLGEKAALAALSEDVGWVRARVEESLTIRVRLRAALAEIGLRALPSAANFLCVPVPDSASLGTALIGRGIKVRVLRALPGIGDAIRVGVGPWELMERLVKTLREVLR
jgi:histidinol-phosphate aminotransferase